MTPLQNLHYALGEMAYAVARADGEVQKEERQKIHNIVTEELKRRNFGFDISGIIFQIMDKEKNSAELAYEWGIKQVRLNSHYLSPELKDTFICVMEKVAEAFPPITKDEQSIINRFKRDIEPLKGDPIYYGKLPES